jgi:hypothetical protein
VTGTVDPLPVARAAEIVSQGTEPLWLIERLWAAEGVGVIGGAPKSCKTWLALDIAVSVASGTPALGAYPVVMQGPVLLYGAEDAAARLRDRLEEIAAARGVRLPKLDVHLILAPALRLDTDRDRLRLRRTLELHKPRLLVLDPLVRLHRVDENSAGEMSGLLGELRALQRDHNLALVVVHHLRKNGSSQDGQSLRGSGDLHAWGDSNLYLRRREQGIRLTVEHRSAPPADPCLLELTTEPFTHLRISPTAASEEPRAADIDARVLAALAAHNAPMTREQLRVETRSRNATVGEALVRLRATGAIERCDAGFKLRADTAIPIPTTSSNGNGNGNVATRRRPSV